MKAAVGDRIVIAANRSDGPIRDGEVLSVGADGGGSFRVRWSDSGHETLFSPGPDAHVQHFEHATWSAPQSEATSGITEASRPSRQPEKTPSEQETIPAHTKSWRVDIYLYEGRHATSAQAVLHGDAASNLKSLGVTHRDPADPDVPEIGDEVAAARALGRLSQLLLGTAAGDLSDVTGHQVTFDH
jgi:hypothetical protein